MPKKEEEAKEETSINWNGSVIKETGQQIQL